MASKQKSVCEKCEVPIKSTHKHKCPNKDCGHIWEHGNDCMGDEKEHKCPQCGAMQWEKYLGNRRS
jgi:predicted RNA-binding Zn-ribbon protein involved in translation (DUF1610 family)